MTFTFWLATTYHRVAHGKPQRYAQYRAGQLTYSQVQCPCGERWDDRYREGDL